MHADSTHPYGIPDMAGSGFLHVPGRDDILCDNAFPDGSSHPGCNGSQEDNDRRIYPEDI